MLSFFFKKQNFYIIVNCQELQPNECIQPVSFMEMCGLSMINVINNGQTVEKTAAQNNITNWSGQTRAKWKREKGQML